MAERDVSRRRLLELSAGGAAGLLAGCSSDTGNPTDTNTTTTTTESGGGDDTTEDTTTAEQWVDQTFRLGMGVQNFNGIEFNPWSTNANWENRNGLIIRPSGRNYQLPETEYQLQDIADWELDRGANELRVTFKDALTWTQGGESIDPVTAEDWVLNNQMGRAMTPADVRQENPPVVGWHATGPNKKTVVYELNPDGYNGEAVQQGPLGGTIVDTYRNGPFEAKLEAIQDASSKDEKDRIRTGILENLSIALEDEPPLGGPWMLEQVAQQTARFTLNEDHWLADVINFKEMEMVPTGSTQKSFLMGQNDQIDLGVAIPDTVETPPDHLKTVYGEAGIGYGEGIFMNYGSPMDPFFHNDDLHRAAKARQAVAHALDVPQQIGNRWPPIGNRPKGLTSPYEKGTAAHQPDPKLQNNFPEFAKKLPVYLDHDLDAAAKAMREAGATKDGGTWYNQDGDAITFEFWSFASRRKQYQTLVQNLKDFGLKATFVGKSAQQIWGPEGEGETPAIMGWMDHNGPMSYIAIKHLDTRSRTWSNQGVPDEWPVPPMDGPLTAEPTDTVDVRSLIEEISSRPESENREATKKFMWVNAYHLPFISLQPIPNSTTVNTTHFEWPKSPDGQFVVANAENGARIWNIRGGAGRALERGFGPVLAKRS